MRWNKLGDRRKDKLEIIEDSADANIYKQILTANSFVKRNQRIVFLCLLGVMIATISYLSTIKILSPDEFLTSLLVKLHDVSHVWTALGSGANDLTPTFVLLTKCFWNAFGRNDFALRMPPLIAFSGMMILLYRTVSARTTPVYGFLAMLVPTMTASFSYSYEAGPYALVMLFGALAFSSWMSVGKQKRVFWLFCIASSVAAAICSNYSGILIILPLIAGEITRTRLTRRFDLSVWIALLLGLTPVFIFLPLIQAIVDHRPVFRPAINWENMYPLYDRLLSPVSIIFLFAGLTSVFALRANTREEAEGPGFHSYELIAAGAFAAIPVVGTFIGIMHIANLTYEDTMPAILGFSILIPYGIRRLPNRNTFALLAFVIFILGFGGNAYFSFQKSKEDSASFTKTVGFLGKIPNANLPIVSWVVYPAAQVWEGGPKELALRLFYLTSYDPHQFADHDTLDLKLIDLKPWLTISNIRPYKLFIHEHEQFLFYYCSWQDNWRLDSITSWLLKENLRIELISRQGDQFLFLVSRNSLHSP